MNYFMCIDLKTFFASVECVERGLDPFKTDLVVADPARTNGAICLAISPKMKARGIRNRCRIFEIPKNVNYIIAKPRMQKYIDYAANVYAIYLRFFAKEDIHVYSIDEAFIDVTHYLKLYKTDPESLAKRIMDIILKELGITATAGVGTNLYLAKIALDITAKHVASNIGYLDENKFIEELGGHTNLTDFWQIGRGTEKRLHRLGIKNMNEIRETNPAILYKEFGINAELMIDHASGRESCTMADIKKYKSKSNSLSNSQILFRDYTYFETKTIVKEMCDLLSLNLIDKELETSVIGLAIGYSKDTRAATGMSMKIGKPTNTFTNLMEAYLKAYEKSTDKEHPIRRVSLWAGGLTKEGAEQLELFTEMETNESERELERTMNDLKKKFGKSAVLRGINLSEEGTTRERNKLIGGHNAN